MDKIKDCDNCQNCILTSDEYGDSYFECLAKNINLNLVEDKAEEARECDNYIGY